MSPQTLMSSQTDEVPKTYWGDTVVLPKWLNASYFLWNWHGVYLRQFRLRVIWKGKSFHGEYQSHIVDFVRGYNFTMTFYPMGSTVHHIIVYWLDGRPYREASWEALTPSLTQANAHFNFNFHCISAPNHPGKGSDPPNGGEFGQCPKA